MRLNKYLAANTALSRRSADQAILDHRVLVNSQIADSHTQYEDGDTVKLDNKEVVANSSQKDIIILLNKPVGYVCSKDGQGSSTIFNLLPKEYQNLNIAGRLDKDSSGLVLLTNNGNLLNQLTHPKYNKNKLYEINISRSLSDNDKLKITGKGVILEDGRSKLELKELPPHSGKKWQITMHEGRNRQIRRTFEALNYKIYKLHRVSVGEYKITGLKKGTYTNLSDNHS